MSNTKVINITEGEIYKLCDYQYQSDARIASKKMLEKWTKILVYKRELLEMSGIISTANCKNSDIIQVKSEINSHFRFIRHKIDIKSCFVRVPKQTSHTLDISVLLV